MCVYMYVCLYIVYLQTCFMPINYLSKRILQVYNSESLEVNSDFHRIYKSWTDPGLSKALTAIDEGFSITSGVGTVAAIAAIAATLFGFPKVLNNF